MKKYIEYLMQNCMLAAEEIMSKTSHVNQIITPVHATAQGREEEKHVVYERLTWAGGRGGRGPSAWGPGGHLRDLVSILRSTEQKVLKGSEQGCDIISFRF